MIELLLISLQFCSQLATEKFASLAERQAAKSQPRVEVARYLRPSGTDWVFESEIRLTHSEGRLELKSVTGREKSRLTLAATFDRDSRLLEATVTTERENEKQSARAAVSDGKARVTRHGGEESELDCPAGVIVTSAPDWTDAFLMVRRYDRTRGGKQEFAGLWIHPTQPPLRPTFSIDCIGDNTVQHDGQDVRLDRFLVVLRGGTRYIAWGNNSGRMVRLVPQNSPQQGIALDSWEHAAGDLAPDKPVQ